MPVRVLDTNGFWIVKAPAGIGCYTRCLVVPKDLGWQFNGDYERPTFTPSVKQTWEYGEQRIPCVDHYTITDGQVHFHPDSTHGAAGLTVPLDELTEPEIAAQWPKVSEEELIPDAPA
jgi:hypothetical protein